MKFIGYQKHGDEILGSLWNITRGPAKGTTVFLSPEPTAAEKAAKLREKARQFSNP